MQPPTEATHDGKPAERQMKSQKNSRRRRWLAPAMSLGLAPLILLAAPGTASARTWCFKSDGYSFRKGDTTWAKGQTQDRKTWQDSVWRGPTFRCPWNVPSCSYRWDESKTAGWQWQVGLSINVPIPYVKDVLGSLTPSYGRNGSTTTTYSFTVNLQPGQYAQPVSVVERRWTQGTFVGAFRTDGSTCGDGKQRFWWDGDYQWGKWQTNLRVRDYGTYNVYS
ncbi:hypothetical protein [Streptomyces bicolor]|uniref:hypothetical protein n=1 Tax=Streptomyces bicolor TaxID=66874 RepID=UPI0004E1FA31|nr:hypothetical protein [Streptomyces bicolor]